VVLSSLSIACLIVTLVVFRHLRFIKKPRDSSTTKDLTRITTHLCICLLLSLAVFLSGILLNKLKIKVSGSI
jgi:hypothetical protein